MKSNWIRKIVTAAVPLFLAAATGVAQSGPPALPTGEVIGYWGFNDTNWLTMWGLPPRTATNLTSVPSWEGNALQIDSTNAASLFYNIVDTWNGEAVTNLSLTAGTVEGWIAPNWDSGDNLGGWGRVLEIGNFSDTNFSSAFGIYISPDGTGLYVSGRTNNLTTNYLSAPLSWNYGEWHYLILTYDETASNTVLYLDGQVADSNNIPLVLPAGPNPSTNWFTLGADSTGTRQMHAMLDEVYSYNYALDGETVAEYYAQLSPFVFPLPTTQGGGSHAMDSGPPTLPGGGGSGGTTNVVGPWSPTNMFSPEFRLGIAPPGTNQWNSDSNSIVIILNQTTNDTVYILWSTTNLTPPVTWTVEQNQIGNSTTNWTAFIVSMAGRGPQTFFAAIDNSADLDGDGLPDWWEEEYFGKTGIDPYGDPMGDGYSNWYKFQNGMNPTIFYQPAAPVGFTSALNTNGSIVFSWPAVAGLPSGGGGTVTNYVIRIAATPYSAATNIIVSATATNFIFNPNTLADFTFYLDSYLQFMTLVDDEDGELYEDEPPVVGFQANFTRTNSVPVTPRQFFVPACSVNAAIVRGPQGAVYLAVTGIPQNVTAIRVLVGPYAENYPINAGFAGGTSVQYIGNPGTYPSFDNLSYFDVPVSSLTNGIYQIPVSRAPLFVGFTFTVMGMDINGNLGLPQYVSPNDDTGYVYNGETSTIPFLDGRTNIAQNINILLRGADNLSPYSASVGTAPANPSVTNLNYVFAGFYFRTSSPGTAQIDEFEPFEDNNLYNFFAFNLANFDISGDFINGVDPYYGLYPSPDQIINVDVVSNLFSAYNYGVSHTNFPMAGIPPVTTTSNTGWLLAPSFFQGYTNIGGQNLELFDYGVTSDGVHFTVPSGVRNIYGLPLNSLIYEPSNTSSNLAYPNHTYAADPYNFNLPFYANVAQPALQTVGYYFARPRIDPMPGDANFSTTNVTPTNIFVPIGQSMRIAAFAKQAVTNGYSGVYAYPQQYFDKAVLADTNGNPTTNIAGILSEYGDFFPTQAGQIILTTKPDFATGTTGQVTIHVFKMQLDVNHDGTMDTSFAGPDNTSPGSPFRFWINNDNDGVGVGQEVDITGSPSHADYISGLMLSQRDLEDYARLWLSGMPPLSYFANGYVVGLYWTNVTRGNPSIKVFRSADADGGIGYLTNASTASTQTGNTNYNRNIGTVSSNTVFYFSLNEFVNGGDFHYLFEGATAGQGQLVLNIAQNGTNLATASAYIDLHDIDDLYERAIITNTTAGAISNWTSGIDKVELSSVSDAIGDTNIIVYVHGGANGESSWLERSETLFKRLYWAGYHGKLATVRWPSPLKSAMATLGTVWFNQSEVIAYKSASSLTNYLGQLRGRFPGYRFNLLPQSLGGAVVSEAIREGASFDTLILCQCAISASCYDVNAPTNADMLSLETGSNITPNWQPLGYHGAYTNLTGRVVNYFNTNDNFMTLWTADQLNVKPTPRYSYDGTNSWYIDFFYVWHLVADSQESRAMVSRSRTLAIGNMGPISGQTSQGVVQSAVDIRAQFGIGSSGDEHSAFFTRPIQTILPFYLQILQTIKP